MDSVNNVAHSFVKCIYLSLMAAGFIVSASLNHISDTSAFTPTVYAMQDIHMDAQG